MKSIIGLANVAIIAVCIGSGTAQSQEIRLPGLQTEQEFHDGMPVDGVVETFFGDFELDHSFPTAETADKIYELIDHQRAAQLYLWGLPIVAMERVVQNYFENFEDYDWNTIVRIDTFNERRGYLTANETTNYTIGLFNTKDSAVIMDIPPGVIIGMFNDMWEQSPSDIGIYGPNAGRGGRHVIFGPNTPRDAAPDQSTVGDDYKIHQLSTDRGLLLMRVTGSTPEEVEATWSKVRLFNYGDEPTINVISGEDLFAPTYQPRGMAYWKLLHAAINNESVAERDRLFMYWLRTLGIERGKPFAPNERQIRALEDGVKVGELMAKTFVFSERLPGVLRPNDWRYVLGGAWGDGIKFTQRMRDYDIFDPRARYTYEAQTTSPSMTVPRPGIAQGYLGKFEDSEGNRLKGEERYVIEVGSQIPAELFWSFTIYDPDTRVLLDNRNLESGGDVTVDSVDPNLRLNEDGSFVVMLGPDAPPVGWEANYVQTIPGRGWFPYMRAYGAKKEFFDDSWELPNIVRVENFDQWIQ